MNMQSDQESAGQNLSLGVILARAGSVGLLQKHLQMLLGKPVIQYTFEHARKSRLLSRTVVSTDCPNIKRLARINGLAVVDRPAELATSDASVQDVMLHAWDAAGAAWPQDNFSAAVVLYGNVPVRPDGLTDQALALLYEANCDSVRSFSPVGKWHPRWMAKLTGANSDVVEPLHVGSIHRRQDLEQLFLHDGGVVAVSAQSLLAARSNRDDPHSFFGVHRRGFALKANECVIEIDHPRDLFWAEAALRSQSADLIGTDNSFRTAV